jgi:hypothetical protein
LVERRAIRIQQSLILDNAERFSPAGVPREIRADPDLNGITRSDEDAQVPPLRNNTATVRSSPLQRPAVFMLLVPTERRWVIRLLSWLRRHRLALVYTLVPQASARICADSSPACRQRRGAGAAILKVDRAQAGHDDRSCHGRNLPMSRPGSRSSAALPHELSRHGGSFPLKIEREHRGKAAGDRPQHLERWRQGKNACIEPCFILSRTNRQHNPGASE